MALRRKKEAAAKQGKDMVKGDLESLVTSGPQGAYEALQLFRSKAQRLRSKGDVNGAIKEAATGAKSLLRHNYDHAGVEMNNLFLEILNENGIEINAEIRHIINEIDDILSEKRTLRLEFLKGCVKWTIKCGARELGDPKLHVHLAMCLWDLEGQQPTAIYHFAAGEDSDQLCRKIVGIEDHLKREQTLTLGVCHFLALDNLKDANELYALYIKLCKSRGFPKGGELITFCDYLLQTCRRDAAPLYKQLVNAYKAHLDFDENVGTLLTGPVGQRMFGIQPRPNMMSMLQHMLN